jgi:hypothetical protein
VSLCFATKTLPMWWQVMLGCGLVRAENKNEVFSFDFFDVELQGNFQA